MSVAVTVAGANLIASALYDLGIRVVFGIVGIPVIEVADACLEKGIRFISFRNEQSASYAATAYGYLTGRPGVCLVVGGPGVLHAIAGIGNSTSNCFPLLVLAGSSESHQVHKGAFQEIDQVSMLTPFTKFAGRPPSLSLLPSTLEKAYRLAYYGRPGATYIDLPADQIQGTVDTQETRPLYLASEAPKFAADPSRINKAAHLIRNAKLPLVIIGKGAAYSRAEDSIREFITEKSIPFLPTPMGKGVIPDSSPLNFAAARSAILSTSDVILLLGGRLNWILHYGEPPKFKDDVKIIQVDIAGEEIGNNNSRNSEYGLVGNIELVVKQLSAELQGYKFCSIPKALLAAREENIATSNKKANDIVLPLTYQHSYKIIKDAIRATHTRPIYISEGANAMDIARSAFDVEEPRQRLDAGTMATMGVGIGYAIAAAVACPDRLPVCIEGDSAFGFSAMELETATRSGLKMAIFVMNNNGVYHGVEPAAYSAGSGKGLPSTALGFETRYDMIAEAVGGKGLLARTPEELKEAATTALTNGAVTVVNVIIDPGAKTKLEFGWLASTKQKPASKL
ncbi:thiamine pyrophosphate enzyme, N-terminal TPP binding domain-containing protein [Lipomyces kononenkoae]|uniref:Thiamine pyrophosphate enzyme, N-terminal TPP binding domain-containing protein n=1 Tax=Lipomyces kononenkoae TaxID=34357 RepID=A0ACC3T955_LIPKO